MAVFSDEYRVVSVVMFALGCVMAVGVHLAPELCVPGYAGTAVAFFMAANYWCGFPFHGWWKRRNLWR